MSSNIWNVEADGVMHVIEFKKGFKRKLIIDGKEEKIKAKNIFTASIDMPINIGSKEIRLVGNNKDVDLAVDGVCLNSKKEYIPIPDMPKWNWIFVIISVAPIIVFLGGALNAVFVLIGATLCVSISKSTKYSLITKIILNTVISLSVWILNLIMGIIVFSILH